MKVQCKNCLPEGIEIPDFNQLEKHKLLELTIQSPIRSVKYIIDNYKLSHRDAKYIVTHINKTYGRCNCCVFDKLEEEYIKCPKCGALNFNWKPGNENRI
jgi:hypothetical protein